MVSGTSGGKLYLGEDISSPKEVFSKDYSSPGGKYSKRLICTWRDYLILPEKASFREKILLLQRGNYSKSIYRKNNPYIREKYYLQ